jgi:hypothetical protein
MARFNVHMRVTHVEEYSTEVEAENLAEARGRAIDQDDLRDEVTELVHACTETRSVTDPVSGEELWNESYDVDLEEHQCQ